MNIKTLALLGSLLATGHAIAAQPINLDAAEILKDFKDDDNLYNQGQAYARVLLYAPKQITKWTNFEIVDFKPGSTTTATIKWQINPLAMTSEMRGILPLYEGEAPKLTSQTHGVDTKSKNALYFYEKPLGQKGGITYTFPEGRMGELLKTVLKDTKAFIKVSHGSFETHIPIYTTTSNHGCGGNIFAQDINLLCIQTTSPTEDELSIGFERGYTNKISIPHLVKNKDEITTTIVTYYKDFKL